MGRRSGNMAILISLLAINHLFNASKYAFTLQLCMYFFIPRRIVFPGIRSQEEEVCRMQGLSLAYSQVFFIISHAKSKPTCFISYFSNLRGLKSVFFTSR